MVKIFYFALPEQGHFNIGLSIDRYLRIKYNDEHQIYIAADQCWSKTLQQMQPGIRILGYEDPEASSKNTLSTLCSDLNEFAKLTPAQMAARMAESVNILVKKMLSLKPQIEQLLNQLQFDYILTDHVSVVPYLTNKNIPWGLAFSFNFLMFGLPSLPPPCVGLSLDDQVGIQRCKDECMPFLEKSKSLLDCEVQAACGQSLPYNSLFLESDHLNLYLCPKELDYFNDSRFTKGINLQAAPPEVIEANAAIAGGKPLLIRRRSSYLLEKLRDEQGANIGSNKSMKENYENDSEEFLSEMKRLRRRSSRKSIDIFNVRPRLPGKWLHIETTTVFSNIDPKVEIPKAFTDQRGPFIYLNMGSLFSSNTNMMQKLLGLVEKLPYYFIVSKGPFGESLQLPVNCWGMNILPQRTILQTVSLAIHHGGNSTLTECFYYGVPSLVLPLIADQIDNAERLRHLSLGKVLDVYRLTKDQLAEAIQELLDDTPLRARMLSIAERMMISRSFESAMEMLLQYAQFSQEGKEKGQSPLSQETCFKYG